MSEPLPAGWIDEEVTRWSLELCAPAQLRRARVPEPAPLLMRARVPLPMLNRFLYSAVGGHWYWVDRLSWSYARWMEYLLRPALSTWVLYVDGTPAGYAELEQQDGGTVEIAYFGLMREFIGRGLGGHLLTAVIDQAFAMDARRVWVHTCTLDGPQALANYQARGMTVFREERKIQRRPLAPPGPWPGALDAETAR